MKKKQIFTLMLAMILLCVFSVAGTLAFLAEKLDGKDAVKNTFVAAGGGKIIEEDDDPDDDPDDDETPFALDESAIKYVEAEAKYSLDTEATRVTQNTYDKIVPKMAVPKDPAVTVNLVAGVDAYVFVKVIDTTEGNLTYELTENWTEIDVAGDDKVYVYMNAVQHGTEGVELNKVLILKADDKGNAVTAAETLKDVNAETAEDMELGEVTFEAYVCQAGGFDDAAAAFTSCFTTTTPPATEG